MERYSISMRLLSVVTCITLIFQTKGNSNAMEADGFKQSLELILNKWKLPVKNFISDRHIQIRKLMREVYGPNRKNQQLPLINHYLDPWHVSKSKLDQMLNAFAQ